MGCPLTDNMKKATNPDPICDQKEGWCKDEGSCKKSWWGMKSYPIAGAVKFNCENKCDANCLGACSATCKQGGTVRLGTGDVLNIKNCDMCPEPVCSAANGKCGPFCRE